MCLETFVFGVLHQTMNILSCLFENMCVPGEHEGDSMVIADTLLMIGTIVIILHSCCCLPVGALKS